MSPLDFKAQVRISTDLEQRIKALAKDWEVGFSEALRIVLERGVEKMEKKNG